MSTRTKGICPATGSLPADWTPWLVKDGWTVCQLHAWGRTVQLDRNGLLKPHVPARPFPLVALLLPEYGEYLGDYDIEQASTLWDYAGHYWTGGVSPNATGRDTPTGGNGGT